MAKVFVTAYNSFIPSGAVDVLHERGVQVTSRGQGAVYVVARNKADALARLDETKASFTKSEVRLVDNGLIVELLQRDGYLRFDGATVAVTLNPHHVLELVDGDWSYVGVEKNGQLVSAVLEGTITYAIDKLQQQLNQDVIPNDALKVALYALQLQLDELRRTLGREV